MAISICTRILIIILTCLSANHHALAQNQQPAKPWTGTLGDRTIIDEAGLREILRLHKKWMQTSGREGKKANFERANLVGANFQDADLREANFRQSNLSKADFQGAKPLEADFQGAQLFGTKFQGAKLNDAQFPRATISSVQFQNAVLWFANFSDATLFETNFQKAALEGASFERAVLLSVNFLQADLRTSFFDGARFELKPNCLPQIQSFPTVKGLSTLKYEKTPHALIELREALKKAGMRKQEREITYAIKHSGFLLGLKDGDWWTKAEVVAGYIAFDLTCQWGMSPERPLVILFCLMIILIFPYAFSIRQMKKMNGIWQVWIHDRMRQDLGKERPILLRSKKRDSIGYAIYFSILSAFNIGWRDLNVGNWIARIHPKEYNLRASGWVRVVSGVQSILSVYLLALTVLTYFGRPFESF